MVPGSSVENLMATFTCKDVYLNISSTDGQQQTSTNNQNTTTDGTNSTQNVTTTKSNP